MKIECPDCEGKVIYYRKKINSFICRRCGFEWKKEKKKLEVLK